MARLVDMTGRRFGMMVAIRQAQSSRKTAAWLCQCDCGNTKIADGGDLRSGNTISCGCKVRAALKAGRDNLHRQQRTHGLSRAPEYNAWKNMLSRCYNQNDAVYPGYGGRGIGVCELWKDSFENFLSDMGSRPGTGRRQFSLDRIDNNGNYEPGNCRWVNQTQQMRNTRQNKLVILDGREMSQGEAAEILGITRSSVWSRLKRGKMQYAPTGEQHANAS